MKTSHFGKLQRIREHHDLDSLTGNIEAADSIPASPPPISRLPAAHGACASSLTPQGWRRVSPSDSQVLFRRREAAEPLSSGSQPDSGKTG